MRSILFLLLLLTSTGSYAQQQFDFSRTIAMNTEMAQQANYYSPRGSHHYSERKSALYWTAFTLCYAGGGLIGYPIGTAIGGGTPNWALAGIGAGLVGIGLWLEHVDHKRNYAFDDEGKKPEQFYTSSRRVKLGLAASANTIGIGLQF